MRHLTIVFAILCSSAAAAETIPLDGFVTVDQKCRQEPPPQLKIVTPPRFGKVTLRYDRVMPDFAPGSEFYHCNGEVRRGSAIYYTRARHIRHTDTFTIRVRYENGETKLQHYAVPATNIRLFGRREEHVRDGR